MISNRYRSFLVKIYDYSVVFEPVPEGGYNVVVPAIPEIVTFGETLSEAKAMAREAIACYLESPDNLTNQDTEAAWKTEIGLRIKDIDEGKVRPIPWTEARLQIQR
jgi:predicted RNase H-like HicB family nuclease